VHGILAFSSHNHLMDMIIDCHYGRRGVLTSEKESLLINQIFQIHQIGHPINVIQCQSIVAKIIKKI
jgi:hypothetical protein